jgi:TonB family protein
MITWMLYHFFLSFLLIGAALAAESALHRWRLPTRPVWVGAIGGSFAMPFLLPFLRGFAGGRVVGALAAPGSDASGVSLGIAIMEPVVVAGSAIPASPAIDPILLGGWIAGSLLVGVFLLLSSLRLRLRSRQWKPAVVERTPVLVSTDTGPAVVGLLGSRIVLPAWALALPEPSRTLLLRHEREHQRAGDVPLLNAALAALALCPWNPCLWYAVRRLRLAVEVDCDARVLRGHPDVAAYGELLVSVGGRLGAPRGLAVAAAVEKRSSLEQRIRIMTAARTRRTRLAAVPLAGLAVGLLLLSCEVPEPTRSPLPSQEPDRALSEEDLAAEPAFTPRTVDPRLPGDQRESLTAYLQEHGPAAAGDADGITRTILWVFIGADGHVGSTRVAESSGVPAFDAVAEQALGAVRFQPARIRDSPVPVWVQIPIQFERESTGPARSESNEARSALEPPSAGLEELRRIADDRRAAGESLREALLREDEVEAGRLIERLRHNVEALRNPASGVEAVRADTIPAPRATPAVISGALPGGVARADTVPAPRPALPATDRALAELPTFTPWSVEPRLSDDQRQALTRFLEENYPTELRDAGIDGRVVLWVFVDERGRVQNTRIVESSGFPGFDEVAQQAFRTVTFTPARNRDEAVPVWVQLPIQYNVRR